ncbi:TetR/AcrR family transcriptional regulator [Streptomyces platensis]|uniref:HTH-type transcriptional repressor KstR2 n=1 Tax=Streptomyces platensis TaxID=58346 RepID=A0AAE6NJR6_STRPT|nr:TetR/AcrR family transcriptional regulator [Streptomyces platensis]OSY37363.1 HTH-type transcriptional repressor KstR2 [Streptomyces platensis]QEV54052.1 TetR/AcrR family transcriptional regulator [Streptomyces platensis]
MRADAQRNAEKLRAAAAELFQERGLKVPLKEIARRAGVSHGTLYNLFGTREALIDEVVAGLAADRLGEAAEHALSFEEAGKGFAYYIERVCELQATDPAVADVVSGRFPAAECLMAICGQTKDAATRIIERAQLAGAVRPDFTGEDLLLFFGTNALLARAAADTAPDAWRRQVAFLLTGLSTEPAQEPLSVAPLAPPQMYEVMGRLAGTP